MKDFTKDCHTWLQDNNVHVYRDFFDYKGHSFSIERAGTKWYAIDSSGKEYKPYAIKVIAIRWACEEFDKTPGIISVPKNTLITNAQFAAKIETMYLDYVNNFLGSISTFAQSYLISAKAAELIIELGRLIADDQFTKKDTK